MSPLIVARLMPSESRSLKPGVNAGAVVAWLKADCALGHGHAMAIVALLKGKKGDRPS